MGANLTLNMEARLDEIDRIHTAVDLLAEAEGWEPGLVFQIKLVVEEIGTNIVKYGYDEHGDSDIQITLTSEKDALTMEIVDDGKPYDPFTEAPPPDLDSPVPERPIGGLGVYLVLKLMDEASYPPRGRPEHRHPDQAQGYMMRRRPTASAPPIAAAAVRAPSS